MWVLFDVILLISIFTYLLITNLRDGWSGRDGITSSGENFQHSLYKNDITIGCEAVDKISFSLKMEKWHDGLAKKLGISSDMKTHSKEFDDLVYLVTDNQYVYSTIKDSSVITESVIEIFNICKENGANFKFMRFQNGKIWVEMSTKKRSSRKNKETDINELAEKLVPLFRKISNEFLGFGLQVSLVTDHHFVTESIITSTLGATFFAGMVGYLAHMFSSDFTQMMTISKILKDSLFLALMMVAATAAIAIILLGKSSRTHIVLFRVLLLGFLGYGANNLLGSRQL